MIGQTSTASVPFWLQVAAVVLAPVLAFAGVAIGAAWSGRSARKAWLRQERLAAYLELIRVCSEFQFTMGTKLVTAARTRNEEATALAFRTLQGLMKQVETARNKVDLVGSTSAAEAAINVMAGSMAAFPLLARTWQTGEFERLEWQKAASEGFSRLDEFRKAALRDIGVPRSQRRRRPTKTLTEEDHLRVQSMVRELGLPTD